VPPGSFVRYFSKRVKSGVPFSPRLRLVSMCVIERICRRDPEAPDLVALRLLSCLRDRKTQMGEAVGRCDTLPDRTCLLDGLAPTIRIAGESTFSIIVLVGERR
jgi:hypothetical protein